VMVLIVVLVVWVMLSELEVRNLKSVLESRLEDIVDPVERKCYLASIMILEGVLSD